MKVHFILCFLLIFQFAIVNGKFRAFWNVVNRCYRKWGIVADLDSFGIKHNDDYELAGNKMSIYYKPGVFPTIVDDTFTNGGIPPKGDIGLHVSTFYDQLSTTLKDSTRGPLVLDFESYNPRYQSSDLIYRQLTFDLVQSENPSLSNFKIKEEARNLWYNTTIPFFQSLLNIVRQERPRTLVGYYHYPYCKNKNYPYDQCTDEIMGLNDKLRESMYPLQKALYPSLYNKENEHIGDLRNNFVAARIKESVRINDNNLPILPYVNLVFKDTRNFQEPDVLYSIFWIIKYYGGKGVVMWASSKDFTTIDKCNQLEEYVNDKLGPVLQCMDFLPYYIVKDLRQSFPLPSDGAAGESYNWENLWTAVGIIENFCSEYL